LSKAELFSIIGGKLSTVTLIAEIPHDQENPTVCGARLRT
jgi:hypothetical protein